MKWEVEFHEDFDPEFDAPPDEVQNELRAHALLLEQFAGDKSGGGEKRFYRRLIAKADERFDEHLSRIKKKGT